MTVFASLALVVLVAFGVVVFDRLIGWTMRAASPYLRNDFVGPDGWLIDTRSAQGVFDRRS